MYERCVARKAKKLREKKRAQAKRRVYRSMVLILFIAVALVVTFKAMGQDSQCIYAEEPSIPYTEPKAAEPQNTPQVTAVVDIQPIEEEIQEKETNATTVEATLVVEQEPIIPVISAYNPGEAYYYVLTASDKKDIEKLLYKEARGEPYEGKVAVAAVVLNRFYSDDPRFNRESIHSVITQSGAFADNSDVTQEMLDTVPDLKDAVEDACRGWDPTRVMFEDGAMFFYAPKEVVGYQKQIREGIQVLQIGNHNFHNDFND